MSATADRPTAAYVATDVSPEMIAIAREGWLLEEVGYSARELRAMSPAELREAFEGAGSRLFSPGAGTPKLAEAPSIDRLLTEVCEGCLHHEVSSVDFDPDDAEEHEWLLPFLAIEDQALRQQEAVNLLADLMSWSLTTNEGVVRSMFGRIT